MLEGLRTGLRTMVLIVALVVAAGAASAQNKVPGERALEALVKTALLSFNDANVTDNYAVLHAKLSKPFRQQFPPERLRETFKSFVEKQIDIGIVATYKPTYDPEPKVDDDGQLKVSGFFPTEPTRVVFQLAFIPSDGEWKLISINVKTEQAKQ